MYEYCISSFNLMMVALCCEFRCWGGVRCLNCSEVRDYVVAKTSVNEVYIGIAIIYSSF